MTENETVAAGLEETLAYLAEVKPRAMIVVAIVGDQIRVITGGEVSPPEVMKMAGAAATAAEVWFCERWDAGARGVEDGDG